MEFKGTKGKWEADEDHVASLDDSIHGNIICVIPDYIYPDSQKNWKENALLISKAPEMLEMLKTLFPLLYERHSYETSKNVLKLIKEATES